MTDPITLVFASDDGYAPYLTVAYSSALCHLALGRVCRTVILDGGISPFWRERLEEIAAAREHSALEVLPVEHLHPRLDALFARRGRKGKVTAWSYTTYYRLFLPDLLPACHRCLYLDVDMLVCDDLCRLIDADMQGKSVGVVPDVCLGHAADCVEVRDILCAAGHDMERYFNAGMMLIDLDAWRTRSFIQRMEDAFCSLEHLIYPDQDILNALFRQDSLLLPTRWNFLTPQVQAQLDTEAAPERDRMMQEHDWGIIHYAGLKPWRDPVRAPLGSLWWRHARQHGLAADIAAHETRLIRAWLHRRQESSRIGPLRLQLAFCALCCLISTSARKPHWEGKRQRLRAKLDFALASRHQKI